MMLKQLNIYIEKKKKKIDTCGTIIKDLILSHQKSGEEKEVRAEEVVKVTIAKTSRSWQET